MYLFISLIYKWYKKDICIDFALGFFCQAENKLDRIYTPLIYDDATRLIDHLFKMRNTVEEFKLLTPLRHFMDDLKKLMDVTKKYKGKYLELKAAELKDNEEKLSGIMKWLVLLEGHKDEL